MYELICFYLSRRKYRIVNQTPLLSSNELEEIKKIYKKRNALNLNAGYIIYHVDHIKPLARYKLSKFIYSNLFYF